MRRLSREQLVGYGAAALFFVVTGFAGGDNPSVAHAALSILNNRPPEKALLQTIPPLPTETATAEFTPTSTRTPLPTPTETPTPEFTAEPTPDMRPPCVADILGYDEAGNPGTVPLQLNEPDGHVLQIGGVQSYGLEPGSTGYEMGAQLPFTLTGQLESVGGYSVVVFDNTPECQVESVEIAADSPIGGYGEITVDSVLPRAAQSLKSDNSTQISSSVQSNPDGSIDIRIADVPAGVTIDAQIGSGGLGYSPNTPDSFEIQGEAAAAVAHFSGPNQNGGIITATIELGALTAGENRNVVINENNQGQTEVVISTDTDNDGVPDAEKVIVDENDDGILTPEEEVPQVVKHEIYLPLINR